MITAEGGVSPLSIFPIWAAISLSEKLFLSFKNRISSDEEFERDWKAIEKNERWEVGEEDFIPKWIISGVHKKRGVITEYLVSMDKESIWLPKQEAIKIKIKYEMVFLFLSQLRYQSSSPKIALLFLRF